MQVFSDQWQMRCIEMHLTGIDSHRHASNEPGQYIVIHPEHGAFWTPASGMRKPLAFTRLLEQKVDIRVATKTLIGVAVDPKRLGARRSQQSWCCTPGEQR